MEVTATIKEILLPQEGTSKTTGNTWILQGFVVETNETYPKTIYFEIFGEQRIKDNPIEVDGTYTISFDIESREYNKRWYTSARVWKIVPAEQQAETEQQTQEPALSFDNLPGMPHGDGLPF